TVTGATLSNDCPAKLQSITFSSDDWLDASNRLKDRTLTGSMDVVWGGNAQYTAKYASSDNGAIFTFSVTGKIAFPIFPCFGLQDLVPEGGDGCDAGDDGAAPGDTDGDDIFTYLPLRPPGDPCDDPDECESQVCVDGVCG